MEAVCAMLEHADLVVQSFQSAVRDAELDRSEHPIAILPKGAGELHEWLELGATRPPEPAIEVGVGCADSAAVKLPQFFLEQVAAVDALVEGCDLGELDVLIRAQVLWS